MSIYSVISLLLSVLWLYLGIRTLLLDRTNNSYRLFAALCATMFVWTFFLGAVYSVKSAALVETLLKVAYVGGFLFSPVNLHFFLEVSKIRPRPYLLVLNYLPSVALLISNFFSFFIFSRFERRANEWYGILNAASVRVHLYVLVVLITFILSFLVLLRWNRRTSLNKERIQSRFMLIIFTLTYFTSLVATLILPLFGIHDYQPIGITLFAAYIVGLYFLVSRFKFLGFDRTIPSEEVIANIGEFVFLLDTELRVREVNKAVEMLFHDAARKLRHRPFGEIVENDAEISAATRTLLAGKASSLSMIAHFRTESAAFTARTFVAAMRDRFMDVSGFLVMAREIKEMTHFKRLFRITNRELQVIGLIASGSTYKEASERLSISEKTVERHLANIYNKVGIGNKIELYRIASEYNVTAR